MATPSNTTNATACLRLFTPHLIRLPVESPVYHDAGIAAPIGRVVPGREHDPRSAGRTFTLCEEAPVLRCIEASRQVIGHLNDLVAYRFGPEECDDGLLPPLGAPPGREGPGARRPDVDSGARSWIEAETLHVEGVFDSVSGQHATEPLLESEAVHRRGRSNATSGR